MLYILFINRPKDVQLNFGLKYTLSHLTPKQREFYINAPYLTADEIRLLPLELIAKRGTEKVRESIAKGPHRKRDDLGPMNPVWAAYYYKRRRGIPCKKPSCPRRNSLTA